MRGDQHPRYTPTVGDVPEGPDENRNGGDARGLHRACDEPDRLVADRSSGHEQRRAHAGLLQPLRPLGGDHLAQPHL